MCDIQKWIRDKKPRVRFWRARAYKGKVITQQLKLWDFAEHHLRPGEPMPASIVENEEPSCRCETCGELAAFRLRIGATGFTNDQLWRIRTEVRCETCFVSYMNRRVGGGLWIPAVFKEVLDSISSGVREAVGRHASYHAYLRHKKRLRDEPAYFLECRKKEIQKRVRAARGSDERRREVVRRREENPSPQEESRPQSEMAAALQQFFENERKAKAA